MIITGVGAMTLLSDSDSHSLFVPRRKGAYYIHGATPVVLQRRYKPLFSPWPCVTQIRKKITAYFSEEIT
jgi:hypothetical protein